MKQANKQCNAKLTLVLLFSSFKQLKSDYSLFTKQTPHGFIAILVYVYDLVLVGDDLVEIQSIKTLLDNIFKIKYLGNLKFFLGMEIAHSKSGILLYQCEYTLYLLQDTGMVGSETLSTLMDYTLRLSKASGSTLSNVSSYR